MFFWKGGAGEVGPDRHVTAGQQNLALEAHVNQRLGSQEAFLAFQNQILGVIFALRTGF